MEIGSCCGPWPSERYYDRTAGWQESQSDTSVGGIDLRHSFLAADAGIAPRTGHRCDCARAACAEADEPRIFTNPVFRTASEKYSWLNGVFAVAVGAPGENKVSYSVYRIK